ncbi:MAG: Jag N-terminal domain-containing protein [Oscillospiraceae bacterium]|nr:Jag N-terminal domain-containing protein [Oscillospiraceae bacterium]
MEKSIITTGKTIDDAVETALAQLGLTRDDVTYQVISLPKSGFFGIGAVPAKVQVTYEAPDLKPARADAAPRTEEKKESAPRIALSSASRSKPKAPKADAAPRAEPKPAEKKPEAPKPVEKKPEAPKKVEAPKIEAPKAEKKVEKAERKVEKKAEKVEKKAEKKAERTYAPAEAGSNEEKIEVFIKGLLENMGSQAVPHAWADGDNSYRVDLTGEGLGFLIGRRGETLDAIQHLANYAVNRSIDGHVRINVDAECYREKREDSLRRYARKKAQQVLKNRRRTTLEPMNAYERHVIHASLQDMDNITTHSTGTEPNRRVVIEYVR